MLAAGGARRTTTGMVRFLDGGFQRGASHPVSDSLSRPIMVLGSQFAESVGRKARPRRSHLVPMIWGITGTSSTGGVLSGKLTAGFLLRRSYEVT